MAKPKGDSPGNCCRTVIQQFTALISGMFSERNQDCVKSIFQKGQGLPDRWHRSYFHSLKLSATGKSVVGQPASILPLSVPDVSKI